MIADLPANHRSTPLTIVEAFGVSINLVLFPRSISTTLFEHSRNHGLKLKGEAQWDPLGKVCRITPPIANSQTYS
jgi:hypothetical protein